MRSRYLVVVVALVGSALTLAPASAATACSTRVVAPEGYTATEQAQARSAPVLKVTDAQTAAKPLVVRYTHHLGASAFHQADVQRELINRRVQVVTKKAHRGLWMRATFNADQVTDIDLYVHDAAGSMIGYSEAGNGPEDAVYNLVFASDTGGPGFENINGLPVKQCQTVLTETQNSTVLRDTELTFKLWLGSVGEGGH